MSSSWELNFQKPGNVTEGGSVRAPGEEEVYLLGRSGLTLEELDDQLEEVEKFLRAQEILGVKWTPFQLLKELKNQKLMEKLTAKIGLELGPKYNYIFLDPKLGYPNLEKILKILSSRKKTVTMPIKK